LGVALFHYRPFSFVIPEGGAMSMLIHEGLLMGHALNLSKINVYISSARIDKHILYSIDPNSDLWAQAISHTSGDSTPQGFVETGRMHR
jgi:hypothetical protein